MGRKEKPETDSRIADEVNRLHAQIVELQQKLETASGSDERFQQMFEHTAIGMYQTTRDGQILAANPALLAMLGYKSFDELTGYNLNENGYEPGYERSEFLERVDKEGQVIGLEHSWQRRDGATLFVRESVRAVRDVSGDTMYYDGTVEDITDRKRAEQALRTRERYLKALNAASVLLLPHQGDIPYQSFVDIIGPASLASRVYVFLTHQDKDGRLLVSQVAEWCAEGIESQIDSPDLQDIPVDESYYRWAELLSRGMAISDLVADLPPDEQPLLEKQGIKAILVIPVTVDGEFCGFIGFDNCTSPRKWEPVEQDFLRSAATDLAQTIKRRQAEEALRESEKRYRMATESGMVGVWDWDLKTNDIYVDPRLKALLGYEDHEIRNHMDDWGKRVHPDDVDAVGHEANRHFNGETPYFELAHRMLHKDGSIRWFLARGTAIRDDYGKLIRMLGTDTDITERKQAEKELGLKTALLEAQSEATIDGILAVSNERKVILCNKRFIEMWCVPQQLLDSGDDDEIIARHTTTMVKNPDDIVEKVTYLYDHPESKSRDEIELKDGRILDRFSTPLIGINGENYGRIWYFRDITERKRAEESNERLNEIFLRLGINPDRNMEIIVEQALSIIGGAYSLYNQLDRSDNSLVILSESMAPTDIERRDTPDGHICYEATIRGGDRSVIIEELDGTVYERTDPNVGRYALRSYLGFPIHLGGEAIGSLCVVDVEPRQFTEVEIRVISTLARALSNEEERKRAQQALRQANQQLEATLTALPDLMFEIDRDGRFYSYRAKRISELFVRPEEFIGKTVSEVLPEDAARTIMNAISEAVESGNHTGATFKLDLPSGPAWFELSIAAKGDLQETEGRLIALSRNITERKHLEEELRQLTRLHKGILASVPIGLGLLDSEARITWANSNMDSIAERMRGLRGSCVGEFIDDVFGSKHGFPLCIKQGFYTTGGDTQCTCRFSEPAQDGSTAWFDLTCSPYGKGTTAGGVVCTVSDVTPLVQATQKEAEHRAQLMHADRLRTVGRLAAGVAHEVNNPLSVLYGTLQTVKTGKILDYSQDAEGVDRMLRVTRRIRDIVNDLLVFSRQQPTAKSRHNINDLLKTTLSLVSSQLAKSHIELDRHFGESLTDVFIGGEQMQQVFLNIILNAQDAMPDGGRLTITTESDGENVVVSFSDTGCGIPEEDLDKVFAPFFTTKDVDQGTGLGLSISYGIVKEHGGRIEVVNREGSGSEFRITIPAK